MLFGDLPRGTSIKPANEIIFCEDGIHLKRIPISMIFPETTVAVEPILKTGVEIARIGINGNSVSIYAPGAPENVIEGVRVNGKDVVRNGIAEITVPVTDVQVDGVSKVSGRIANIRIPVKGVVDENDISLVDEDGIAHVNNSGGGGTGDVVDVVDEDGVSLLDINKIAHVPGTTGYVIQPTIDYTRVTEVTESSSWSTTQVTWTAPEDCVIFFDNVQYFLYQIIGAANSDWLYGCGLQNSLFGRCLIPLKAGQQIKFALKAYSSGYQRLYYIPYNYKPFFKSDLVQPWIDYSDIHLVTYTSSITQANQVVVNYTAPKDGIFLPYLTCNQTRYEMHFSINEQFTSYNKCDSENTTIDIFDGIPLNSGDNIKIWYSASSGTLTGKVIFLPFAIATDFTELKSPIPDYENWVRISDITSLLNTNLNNAYYFNQKYPDASSTGNYPVTFSVDGVSDTYNIDCRFAYLGSSYTYDDYRPGRMYASGEELVTATASIPAGQSYIYEIPLVTAEVHREESGGGTDVEITPTVTSGTKIAEYSINGETGELYSPAVKTLEGYFESGAGRTNNININSETNKLLFFTAKSGSSITGGPPFDGNLLHMSWDANENLSSQLCISQGSNPQLAIRTCNSAGTWTQWFRVPRTRVSSVLTANCVVCTYSDSNLYTHEVTTTELTTLKNARSNIQSQIDSMHEQIWNNLQNQFNLLLTSSRYTTATRTDSLFTFSIDEQATDWSSSATIFTDAGIDLTNYKMISITVDLTQATDSGAFWVTLSQTKYSWASNRWPTVYANVDSSIKITESGTYYIDVTALSGVYYIYAGATTGKAAVTHGDCNNSLVGKIVGSVTAIRGSIIGEAIHTTYERVQLFSGGTYANANIIMQLSDSILNYDQIEFVCVDKSGYFRNSQFFDTNYFATEFPYNASITTSTTGDRGIKNGLLCPFSNEYIRLRMGADDSKILAYDGTHSVFVGEIYGIRYGAHN